MCPRVGSFRNCTPPLMAPQLMAPQLTAQGAANAFWAVATLGFSDESVVAPLAAAAAARAGALTPQGASNSLWAAATLGRVAGAEVEAPKSPLSLFRLFLPASC